MRQFDVFANPTQAARRLIPYAVLIQSHYLVGIESRLIAPLVVANALPPDGKLGLLVEFGGQPLTLSMQQLVSVPTSRLGKVLGSLEQYDLDFPVPGNVFSAASDVKARMSARTALLLLLAAVYAGFGIVHLVTPHTLMPLMPGWVPWPYEVILFTGACEIAGGIGLLLPPIRRLAGIMLALYALCVWPANLHHALTGAQVGHIPNSWWYHGPRLAFQPVLIWAPLWAAGVTGWPFSRRA